ncbi:MULTISPECIES: hypothetical protein [Halolamina]|uniref:DUF8055 domain-containing protein n=1 Tax=Halolamina pelagica TaxID=699431 RepID=A0A1I5QBE5_9EURY|nr:MULTISPECIES: hypothetical protein [Halolamina]NHX35186.1 hypothetical protein [Halolamina sp. R1-12]SFP43563.1 hypothetical protein SAMN05216277_103347 [Halolamina pelagica]
MAGFEGCDAADADGPPPSRYAERIERLAREARTARAAWGDGEVVDDPNEQRALEAARDGLGPVVACYVEARTGDDPPRFSAREHRLLRRATRDWLECFARCHGVDHDSDATVRSAAEVLLETHDVVAVAELLTGVSGE